MKYLVLIAAAVFSMEITNYYKNGKFISEKKFEKLVKSSKVIYVGEQHDQKGSHSIQLEVLKLLYEKNKEKICVGFEMLNRTLQPVLDKYVSGEISEEEFLKEVDWKKEWGFDFNLYKPIFDFIKEKKLKAIALNIPRSIVSKVARGGMESLTEDEKKIINCDVKVVDDKRYIDYLRETFSSHDNPMSKMMTFDNYLLSMSLWNESMGAKIGDFLKNNKDYAFVVIAGNGHILYNAAIPWSLKRRIGNIKQLSIYTEPIETRNDLKKLHNIQDYADIIAFY